MQPTLTPEYLASQELSENFPRRFWEKIEKRDGCWAWSGAKTKMGYGNIWRGIPKRPGFIYMIYSHRAAWVLLNGPIPDGLQVLHKCDNPQCCNPEHLFLGSAKDNMDDKVRKGRARTGLHHGTRNGCAKLTDDKVRSARGMARNEGKTSTELAAVFGVSEWTMRYALNGKTWSHVS